MMHVRHMGMAVLCRPMRMPMTVEAIRHRIISMGMMAVIMSMGVFMLQWLVYVLMLVLFGDVQHDTRHHQGSAAQQPQTVCAFA